MVFLRRDYGSPPRLLVDGRSPGRAAIAPIDRIRCRCASTTMRSTSGCCRGIAPTRNTRAASTSRTTAAAHPGGHASSSATEPVHSPHHGLHELARRARTGHLHAAVSREDPHAAAGARPNAGWLYVSQAVAIAARGSVRCVHDHARRHGSTVARALTQQASRTAPPRSSIDRPTGADRSRSNPARSRASSSVVDSPRRRARSLGFDLVPRVAFAGNVLTAAESGPDAHRLAHVAPVAATLNARGITLVSGRRPAPSRATSSSTATRSDGTRVGHDPFVKSAKPDSNSVSRGLSWATEP